MLEIETKYRVENWDRITSTLIREGAVEEPIREDCDHYFNAPDRDFAATDEALRLRRIGDKNYFTYKGPKTKDTSTKTRVEVELPLETGSATAAQAVRWLTALGYSPVAVVSKSRRVFRLERDGFRIEVCLDDVGAIGKFMEIEILAEQVDLPRARDAILNLAAEWGLGEPERRSYLQLLLSRQ